MFNPIKLVPVANEKAEMECITFTPIALLNVRFPSKLYTWQAIELRFADPAVPLACIPKLSPKILLAEVHEVPPIKQKPKIAEASLSVIFLKFGNTNNAPSLPVVPV